MNRDFRYQLTPIGAAFTPYVAEEISGNRFKIAGAPGKKVSWQVTGIRQDAWANANRIPVEEDKPEGERGLYLHPAAWGKPVEKGVGRPRRSVAPQRPTEARVAAPQRPATLTAPR